MLAFVDESGDAGMKFGQGSSPYLIVTVAVFSREQDAMRAEQVMVELRQQLGWKQSQEFHFNKMKAQLRKKFLSSISGLPFRYYSFVMNKRKLRHEGFQDPESLYKCACNYLFSNTRDFLKDAIVVLDGSGSRQFKKQLTSYLRRRANEHGDEKHRLIRKVKIQDSRKNNLIQFADMLCGAVARSYADKPDSNIYRNLVKKHEAYVQLWPKA